MRCKGNKKGDCSRPAHLLRIEIDIEVDHLVGPAIQIGGLSAVGEFSVHSAISQHVLVVACYPYINIHQQISYQRTSVNICISVSLVCFRIFPRTALHCFRICVLTVAKKGLGLDFYILFLLRNTYMCRLLRIKVSDTKLFQYLNLRPMSFSSITTLLPSVTLSQVTNVSIHGDMYIYLIVSYEYSYSD